MPSTELYLIRHAESVMNTQAHLISGRSNETPLTARGVEQAKQLGRYLFAKNILPDKVFTSPAERTVQTAKYALAEMECDLVPVVDDELQEMHQGAWVGQPRVDIYAGSVLSDIARLGKDFKSPEGESMNEVGERMLSWVKASCSSDRPDNYNPQRVIAFTHGIAIRCLASVLHDWPHDKTYQTPTDNTSISLFTNPNGQWQLDYLARNPDLL